MSAVPKATAAAARSFRMVLVSAALGVGAQCEATTILDQSFTQPGGASAFINEAFRYVAQTYTARRDGQLAAVSVEVDSVAGFALRVSIRAVVDGLTTADVLGETLLTTSHSGINDLVSFDEHIAQRAGVQYAIALDYPGEPAPAGLAHRWDGAAVDAYAGGALNASVDGMTWVLESPGVDLHVRTFVSVATPSSLALVLSALLPLGCLGFLNVCTPRSRSGASCGGC